MRNIIRILTSRLIIVIALIALQIWFLTMSIWQVALYYQIMGYLEIFAVILAIYIINKQEDPSYKIAWIVTILVFPVFGGLLYILCAGRKMPKKLYRGTTQSSNRMRHLLKQDQTVLSDLKLDHPHIDRIFEYGLRVSDFPVYDHTDSTFFECGEDFLPVFLEELKKAKQFIFMEYFIIEEGKVWDQILEILLQKVEEGVEVKIVYDDMGCMDKLPYHYSKKLNHAGIETYRFNRLKPNLIVQMNNRDHRKICVIDNKVGFTGGINLADEYMNYIERFGYWRDSAIMIKGSAVWSLTVMFLGMYSYLKKDDDSIDYNRYNISYEVEGYHGLYQPFSDTPTDDADVALGMHLNIVNHSMNYVYIDTPYLILNNDMITALTMAAQNGVDVKILVPGVPDKVFAYNMTKHNYGILLKKGVRIFEYTPGFNHTKNIVSDDRVGIVGSVNTDYRSYYLHFEDGILMYDSSSIIEMRKSFEKALQQSKEVTLEEYERTPWILKVFRALLNLIAPLF